VPAAAAAAEKLVLLLPDHVWSVATVMHAAFVADAVALITNCFATYSSCTTGLTGTQSWQQR